MILNGWKEIANHLGRGVRTVQRWEQLGLPVRRPKGTDRSAVLALSEELDAWVKRCVTQSNRNPDFPAEMAQIAAKLERTRTLLTTLRARHLEVCERAQVLRAEMQSTRLRYGRDGYRSRLAMVAGGASVDSPARETKRSKPRASDVA